MGQAREKLGVGRLAMRVEGDWWVAYYAAPDSMADAIELGRVKMGIVQEPERRDGFMALMKGAITDFIRDTTGAEADWPDVRPAPEHERSGRA
ncbi:hypothetical protein [Pseudooceanicola sp.]|uniref:hypothetical protein n=1 Tax=Pseudooceanicola sp. TaxID=1914328 RepID=UPI004058E168